MSNRDYDDTLQVVSNAQSAGGHAAEGIWAFRGVIGLAALAGAVMWIVEWLAGWQQYQVPINISAAVMHYIIHYLWAFALLVWECFVWTWSFCLEITSYPRLNIAIAVISCAILAIVILAALGSLSPDAYNTIKTTAIRKIFIYTRKIIIWITYILIANALIILISLAVFWLLSIYYRV